MINALRCSYYTKSARPPEAFRANQIRAKKLERFRAPVFWHDRDQIARPA
jgi:hypothetical protein